MLKEKLQKLISASAAKIPVESKPIVTSATQAVADSIGGRAIGYVGDLFPEFQLADSTGGQHNSKELVKDSQLILNFFRGGW